MAAAETLVLRARSVARSGVTPGAVALAVAIPFLFLHIKYQPGVRVPLGLDAPGSRTVGPGRRRGGAPRRPRRATGRIRTSAPRPAAVGRVRCACPRIFVRSSSLEHFVTAAKFSEYALLAVSAPLILRQRNDWELVAAATVAWSVVATCFGLLQFFGVDMADAWAAGRRQPSFLGHSDFAALSALALGIGLAAVLLAGKRIGWTAVASGGVGLILSGATAGLIGIAAGMVAFLTPSRVGAHS